MDLWKTMPRDRRLTFPGDRMIVLAEQRREGWAGFAAAAVILGVTVAAWLVLSAPQNSSTLAETVVPAADAATLLGAKQITISDKTVVLTAAEANRPLTSD